MMEARTTQQLDPGLVARPLAVRISVAGAPARPRTFVLSAGSCMLGAGRDADIVIDDPTVSRRHAQLELVPAGIALRDQESKNGTFYMGQRVETLVLSPGSSFRLGRIEVRTELDPSQLGEASSELDRYGRLMGSSPAMRQLFGRLERLEGSLVNVLIHGESGTGKELTARAIHKHSPVATGPFVAVNCGALDRELARSEFFGHRRGAFTGATESRVGVFEAAHGGTLFMDEIGELPLSIQPVLLRVLESRTVTPVGDTREREVRVRLVAASHKDLRQEVEAGRFREDLYYRIGVVRLPIPPLRERPEDIVPLARHFAQDCGGAVLPEAFLGELAGRGWPGNGRQLRNAVEAFLAIGASPESTGRVDARAAQLAPSPGIDLSQPYSTQKEALVEQFTAAYLEQLMAHTAGNQSEAARVSGLERSYLSKLLRRHGLGRSAGSSKP